MPSNAMMFYSSEQRAAGRFKDMSLGEGTKELYKQFSQMPEHEKEVAFSPKISSFLSPFAP